MVDVFVVEVPCGDVEVASDRLWRLGVRGIEERDVGGGIVELRTTVGGSSTAVERAAAAVDPTWPWRMESVDDVWDEGWRAHATPVVVNPQLAVVPAWTSDVTRPDGVSDHATVVVIEPRDTFGLGDHPTTRLTLAALAEILPDGASVLDVGCGSGVLAIAARMLGARSVRAIDVSASAVEVTRENAARNGVDGIDADTTPLADIAVPADVVVANILAPDLIAMAADLRRVTGSRLVISGVLADRHDHVVDALSPMHVIATNTADGWAAVTLAPG